jgi:pilus assembly protein FimV
MSQLSQNLEKIIQMISIEQLLGLVKQNTDNKSNSDIMNLPIVQKVVKAYEDEIQTLQTPASSSTTFELATSSLEKDYSGDIAKINEQLASINNNLLQLTEAIRNINITTKEVKREEEVVEELKVENVVDKNLEAENVVVVLSANEIVAENVVEEGLNKVESLEEEHVRLKIEEKQEEVISAAEEEVISKVESVVASSNVVVEEESSGAEEELSVAEEELSVAEEEESEKEISDEESVASSNVVVEEESEKEISDEESASVAEEEVASSNVVEAEAEAEEEEEEEEEEVFEIEIDDVTYYATSEENGILYEVDADGEVGKKVGIIKDGEPIFS